MKGGTTNQPHSSSDNCGSAAALKPSYLERSLYKPKLSPLHHSSQSSSVIILHSFKRFVLLHRDRSVGLSYLWYSDLEISATNLKIKKNTTVCFFLCTSSLQRERFLEWSEVYTSCGFSSVGIPTPPHLTVGMGIIFQESFQTLISWFWEHTWGHFRTNHTSNNRWEHFSSQPILGCTSFFKQAT